MAFTRKIEKAHGCTLDLPSHRSAVYAPFDGGEDQRCDSMTANEAKVMDILGVSSPRERHEVCSLLSRSPRRGEGSFRGKGLGDHEIAVELPRSDAISAACPAETAAINVRKVALHTVCKPLPTVKTHSVQELVSLHWGRKLPKFHCLADPSAVLDDASSNGRSPSFDSRSKKWGNDTCSGAAEHQRNFPLPPPNAEKHLLPSPKKKEASSVAHPLPQPPLLLRSASSESAGAQLNEAGDNKLGILFSTNEPNSREAVPLPSHSETAKRIQICHSEASNQLVVGMAIKLASTSLSAKESPRPCHLLPSRLGVGATPNPQAPAAVSKPPCLPSGGSAFNSLAPSPASKPLWPTSGGSALNSSSPSAESRCLISPGGVPSLSSPSASTVPKSLCPRKWRKGAILGQGSFGIVYEGLNLEDSSFFAVKVGTTEEVSSQIQQEVALLSKLEHPNIVRYLGSSIDNGQLCIFIELVRMGSLETILRKYKRFEERTIRTYTRQILHGLEYLHSQKTIHRDIKSANILVDVNGQVKLSDFGVAKEIGEKLAMSTKGTILYMAPEVFTLRQTCYSFSADIWSLGCTVFEMADGRPPWSDLEGFGCLFMVERGKLPPRPENLSLEGVDFIYKCLQFRACDRPTASELLQHPFVNCVSSQESCVPWVPLSQPSLCTGLSGQA